MSADSRIVRLLKRLFFHNLGLKMLALALALLVYFSIRAEIRGEGSYSVKGTSDVGKQSQQQRP